MNKTELIAAMAKKSGLTQEQSHKSLDSFIECVEETLASGGKLLIPGFGTFSTTERKERTGINPATRAQITIPAKKAIKFKAGNTLSEKVK